MDTLPETELKITVNVIIAFAAQAVKENPFFIIWLEGIPAFQRTIEVNSSKLTPQMIPTMKASCVVTTIAAYIAVGLKRERGNECNIHPLLGMSETNKLEQIDTDRYPYI